MWNRSHLNEFRIEIDYVAYLDFFSQSIPSISLHAIPASFLSTKTSDDLLEFKDDGYYLLRLYDLMMKDRSHTTMFVYELLKSLGYQKDKRQLLCHQRVSLLHHNNLYDTQPAICAMEDDLIIFLVHYADDVTQAECRLIECCFASFQQNNEMLRLHGQPPLHEQTFFCVTFVHDHPRFYQIPITDHVNDGVIQGTRPRGKTRITCYDPFVPTRLLCLYELEDRLKVVKCFKALKERMIASIPS